MSDLVEKAKVFATAAHAAVGQTRKYTNEPYIVHPAAVAKIVASVRHTPEMLAAAWLHDVVEDTEVTLSQIGEEFGVDVANIVFWLTDASRPEDGNRAARKAIDRAHIGTAPAAPQTVKVADLIDNTRSIALYDPDFAVVYRREKHLLLDVLVRADPALMAIARFQIADQPGENMAG